MLTVKEKAIKNISSNGQIDDNLLVSRQCFCLYFSSLLTTRPIILAQKLLVNKNGRLLIQLNEDPNEFGGYFIVNGNEKMIRMLIVQKRNYPVAFLRPSYTNRGPGYT